jgi:hypothetical protein
MDPTRMTEAELIEHEVRNGNPEAMKPVLAVAAKIVKMYYDALVAEGFTREEALEITKVNAPRYMK